MVFEQFDKEYDVETIRKNYEEFEQKSNSYSMEPGEYIGYLTSLEPKMTSTGKPMITARFFLDGHDYYYNSLIYDGRGIYFYTKLLKQLILYPKSELELEVKIDTKDITFNSYSELELMTKKISAVYGGAKYFIKISKSKNNYDVLEIVNEFSQNIESE